MELQDTDETPPGGRMVRVTTWHGTILVQDHD